MSDVTVKIKKDEATRAGRASSFLLRNCAGAEVELCAVGAGIRAVRVPDRLGRMADVVLGYDFAADYIADDPCAGKTPGRFANRIARGRFTIDGREYQLACNNGPNALHGGPTGFQNRIWEAETLADGVRFSYTSADGEEGYPGTLRAEVTYRWSDSCELSIDFCATTDSPTAVNLTNHAYFNLAGHGNPSVLGHELQLMCGRWLPVDPTDIPLGRIEPVDGTPMDFLRSKPLGRDIDADFSTLRAGKGYNHYFLRDDNVTDLALIARLADPASGRVLEVLTDYPGVMLYTGNWLDAAPRGKGGAVYRDHCAVALECQYAPDAPNQPFPWRPLRPGELYSHKIIYRFKTDK